MSKRMRQYLGIITAIAIYYLIHEGAHLIYALFLGVFKQVRFLGLGVQIVAATERLNSTQLGLFCLVGPVAALLAGYGSYRHGKICAAQSKYSAPVCHATIALLLRSAVSKCTLRIFWRW